MLTARNALKRFLVTWLLEYFFDGIYLPVFVFKLTISPDMQALNA